jgi:hypothetical protein
MLPQLGLESLFRPWNAKALAVEVSSQQDREGQTHLQLRSSLNL